MATKPAPRATGEAIAATAHDAYFDAAVPEARARLLDEPLPLGLIGRVA